MRIHFHTPDFSDPRDVREFLNRLEIELDRIRGNDGLLIVGGGEPLYKHRSATATWNPASLNAAAQTSTTVPVSGAALGDEATCSFSLDLQLMQMTAYVSATDTVTVVLRNGTAGTIDLASGTLRVSVWSHRKP